MKVKRTEKRGAHMSIRATVILSVGLALVGLTMGCGEEPVSTAPTSADFEKDRAALANFNSSTSKQRNATATPAPTAESEDEVVEYASSGRNYSYDPRNKRDPFRSYRFMREESGSEKSFGPLGDFELGQLELSAVIWDATNPRALILDPGGRSYIVREGSQIGKNSGQVIHIGDNLVLVKETYENFAGERTTKDVELRIRLSQGG